MAEERIHSAIVVEIKKGRRCITAWDGTFASLAGLPENSRDVTTDDIRSGVLRDAINETLDKITSSFTLNGKKFSVESRNMGKEKFLLTLTNDESPAANEQWQNELDILKLLSEKTNDGFWLMDTNLKTVYMSKAIEMQMGFTPEEYMAMPVAERIPAEAIPIFQEKYQQLLIQFEQDPRNDSIIFELPHKHKNGSVKWGELSVKIIQGENHSIEGFAGVTRNVDEKHRLQEKLNESEMMFRELAEHTPTAIFIYQGPVFVYANPGTERITGYSHEDLMKMNFWDLIAPEHREMVKQRGLQRQQGEEIENRYEFKIVTKTGEIKWVDFAGSLIQYKGKPAAVGSAFDITKIKEVESEIRKSEEKYRRLNKELQRSIEKAMESDKLKSAFIANMSHEIRTPLNAIMGFSEMLTKKELSREKISKYSTVINNSGNHLLSLVSDIIDISKIETGQMDVSFDAINLNILFNETYTFFEQMARDKSLVFKFDVPAEEYNIISDRTKLQQILNNLISNAIKFTEFGEVRFGFRVNYGILNIYVSDTGIGISEKNISVMFERFRQLENNQGKKYQGTGLGLAIVKGLTELLKGSIEVESELDKGTIFSLCFKVEFSEDDSDKTENIICEPSGYSFEGYKILIAEDEIISRLLFAEILQPTGIEIIEAADGKEAFKAYNSSKPDIVILDLGLPKMDGIQVCREIRKNDIVTPVIACSAYAYNTDKEKAYKAGCNGFITKPYQSEQLLGIISIHLQKQ